MGVYCCVAPIRICNIETREQETKLFYIVNTLLHAGTYNIAEKCSSIFIGQ